MHFLEILDKKCLNAPEVEYVWWLDVFFFLVFFCWFYFCFSVQLQKRDDIVDTGTIAGKGDWHALWCISAQSPCF